MKLFVADLGIKLQRLLQREPSTNAAITRLTSPACIPFRRLASSTEAENSEAEVAVRASIIAK